MMIPLDAMEAAKTAMETVTPPPGVDRADWLKSHGPYALLAGAIAAAAPHLMAQAFEEGYGLGYSDCVWSKGHEPRGRNPYRD